MIDKTFYTEPVFTPPGIKRVRQDVKSWMKRCGQTKPNGKICRRQVRKGKLTCGKHGWDTRCDLDNLLKEENVSKARYVKALGNTKLLEKYETALNDEVLLELNQEIALVQALIDDLCERIHDGDDRVTINKLLKVYDEATIAGINRKMDLYNAKFDELGKMLNGAVYQFGILEDIRANVKLKKELVESQTKRDFQLDTVMKANEVLVLVKVMMAEIRDVMYDRLDDQRVADAILNEVGEKVAKHLERTNPNRALQEAQTS